MLLYCTQLPVSPKGGLAMLEVNRRLLLAGGTLALAAVPFADWSESLAQGKPVYTRYGIHTTEGAKQVKTYADAVQRMKNISFFDPNAVSVDGRGWLYQRKIHRYPDNADYLATNADLDAAKAADLHSFFFTEDPLDQQQNAVLAAYAEKIWGRCPHGRPDFFPWHRIYLILFEKIIRKVAQAPNFTLPYWAYSDPHYQAIPAEFLNPIVGGIENPLWNPRNVFMNDTTNPRPLDDASINVADPLNGYWYATTFEDFAKRAERLPHNYVHNTVGNNASDGYDMAGVAMAPRDPIFWVHHCEIDRIWHSWTASGGADPDSAAAWLNNTYYFIDDEGVLVSVKGSDILPEKLNYTYDQVIAPPTKPSVVALQSLLPTKSVATATAQGIVLKGRSVAFPLKSNEGAAKINALAVQLSVNRRAILTLSGIRSNKSISANLEVYLNLPDGASDDAKRSHYVGTLSFFGMHSEPMAGMEVTNSTSYEFDITDLVGRLRKSNAWNGHPRVSLLVRAGSLKSGSLKIDSVTLSGIAMSGE
jgi:tyrosinase